VLMEYVFVQHNIPEHFVDLVSRFFFVLDFKIFQCSLDNPCFNAICRNGGACSINSNSTSVSFTCTCSSLYTGQYCETPMYTNLQLATSCASTCLNGGSCINGVCMCTSQYVGPSCQYGKEKET